MDSNAVFAVLLLIVGLAILCAEVFIPSGGLLGLITFLSLLVSLIFAYRAWWTSHPNIFGAFCVAQLLLVPTVIGLGFYMLPKTSFGKRVLLEAPEPEDLMPYLEPSRKLEKKLGRFGTAVSMLNPGGLVRVDGERLHAFSEGLSIELGASIEVIGVRGSRVLVRPGEPPKDDAEPEGPQNERPSDLDFDFPSV